MKKRRGPTLDNIVLRPDKLDVEYDKENDVLYISAGKLERLMTVLNLKKAL